MVTTFRGPHCKARHQPPVDRHESAKRRRSEPRDLPCAVRAPWAIKKVVHACGTHGDAHDCARHAATASRAHPAARPRGPRSRSTSACAPMRVSAKIGWFNMKLNTLCGGRNTCTGQPSNGSISRSSVCSKKARCKPRASRLCATSCHPSQPRFSSARLPVSLPRSLALAPRGRSTAPRRLSLPGLPLCCHATPGIF